MQDSSVNEVRDVNFWGSVYVFIHLFLQLMGIHVYFVCLFTNLILKKKWEDIETVLISGKSLERFGTQSNFFFDAVFCLFLC